MVLRLPPSTITAPHFVNFATSYFFMPISLHRLQSIRMSSLKPIAKSYSSSPRFLAVMTENSLQDNIRFFRACRDPMICRTSVDDFKRDDTKISKLICGKDDKVEAYLLPKSISRWPSFYASKQKSEHCPEIYFKRIVDSNLPRFDEALRLLCERKTVVSTGLSGIGKSVEVNGMLMELLRHLGEKGWPMEVWYRYDFNLLKFSIKDETLCVDKVKARTLIDVLEATELYESETEIEKVPVLLLEMSEDEINPRSYIPTFIPLSNRGIFSLTKEISKSRGKYLLVNPPTCDEVQTMALVEARCGSNSLFKGMSSEDISALIKERYDIVGPRLRDIFVCPNDFQGVVDELNRNVDKLFSDLKKVSVHNMPSNAKHYLGAFVEKGSFIPSLTSPPQGFTNWYYVDFLSDYITKLVANACDVTKQQLLEAEKFDYCVAESIMRSGLMLPGKISSKRQETASDVLDERWMYQKWKIYRNHAEGGRVLHSAKIANPAFPLCTKKVYFATMYLKQKVSELEEGTLYICSLHNGALYDCLLVSHSDKKVYVFQSSSLRPRAHSLDYSTAKKVMDGLDFDNHSHGEYKLVYIYCSDNSKKSQTGCKVTNLLDMPLPPDVVKAIKRRFKIYIARVCYYPNLSEVDI